MDLLRAILNMFLPYKDENEVDFEVIDDDYYLSEAYTKLTGDSLDGGDVYKEPDYAVNN